MLKGVVAVSIMISIAFVACDDEIPEIPCGGECTRRGDSCLVCDGEELCGPSGEECNELASDICEKCEASWSGAGFECSVEFGQSVLRCRSRNRR